MNDQTHFTHESGQRYLASIGPISTSKWMSALYLMTKWCFYYHYKGIINSLTLKQQKFTSKKADIWRMWRYFFVEEECSINSVRWRKNDFLLIFQFYPLFVSHCFVPAVLSFFLHLTSHKVWLSFFLHHWRKYIWNIFILELGHWRRFNCGCDISSQSINNEIYRK